ncbi:hypothetical protein AYY19_13975 [Photobacterium aquimaris]|uniref:Sel1 repeat family protein n=1 Tax=Photobacterium aquimaris TaxID=512643 RepID=A0A2T3IK99_9GAMM|nr:MULTISPECIES: tetratricopeptide repeat protein [Photobacterium]OBU15666.1 hypothetical protein AYY20_06870 [Photobacterium aquimaris]OBU17345.1 hypothetical protein AYY19_13975 [Photobacterium aquimaris]PSU28780.1 sel1 repeat family protein [Photobacterium aquimaris]PSW01590.1 sel1 repeat family protein [Photobacterium aquimaris]
MKRLILSSLIILTSCSTEKNELPVETEPNNKIKTSSLSYDNNKPPTLSPLSKSILIIENESTSNEDRQQQVDQISTLSNNSDALFYLAALYEEGKLVPLSEAKARKLYQQAAAMEHPLARYYYALMLIDGRGGDVMHDEAESYLLMNHNKGHVPSSYSLGYLYFIQKKHEDVIKTLEKNSQQSNEYSSYLLAISYLELNIKTTTAIDLLQRSAEKGHQFSHLILGDIYRKGLYKTPINTKKSYSHLQAAAKQDNPKALYELAMLGIENLDLINNDVDIAITQLKSADKNGYPEASFELAKIYDQGDLIKQDFTQAIYWYKKSASHGNNRAMYNLASIYINGDGVDSSIEKAEYWLIESAKNGNDRAQDILKK